MSFDALAWASKVRAGSAARKLVLLALADRHNTEEGVARPSIAWIAEWADLNRKTVISALQDLERQGLISDSGERSGRTGQIKAYSLNIETVPKTEQSQKRNSPSFSAKQSQKRDTEPVIEPVSDAKASSSRDAVVRPDWLPQPAYSDFTAMRRKMRNVPFTAAAERLLIAKLTDLRNQGHDPEKLLSKALERGWRTVFEGDDTRGAGTSDWSPERKAAMLAKIDERPPDPNLAGAIKGLVRQVGGR